MLSKRIEIIKSEKIVDIFLVQRNHKFIPMYGSQTFPFNNATFKIILLSLHLVQLSFPKGILAYCIHSEHAIRVCVNCGCKL